MQGSLSEGFDFLALVDGTSDQGGHRGQHGRARHPFLQIGDAG